MRVYILQAYSDEHKYHGDEYVIGYFTNKKILWNAITNHADELGIYSKAGAQQAFWGRSPEHVNSWLDTGLVDGYDVNVCFE